MLRQRHHDQAVLQEREYDWLGAEGRASLIVLEIVSCGMRNEEGMNGKELRNIEKGQRNAKRKSQAIHFFNPKPYRTAIPPPTGAPPPRRAATPLMLQH